MEQEKKQDPDSLLQKIKKEEKRANEGKLRIFFGMCAGVGKTYSMLEAARKMKNSGIDIVAGIVETHKRAETEELMTGLEVVSLKEIEYRNSFFKEMDTDGIIKRNPQIVLVDELAHSNVPGSRHLKRFQDVLELLKNGIDVFTTLNVQHVESRSETVRQITGIKVRETVPDSILERADEIELIDITPGELLQRLKEGKVYTGDKTRQSIDNFFRKGNLTALREMALRITAERIDKDLQEYRTEKGISGVWKSNQKLLVAVGPGPYSADLIRWTRRLAYSMEVPWIAAHIELDQDVRPSLRESLAKNLELAKELGGEIISVQDTDIAAGLLRIARNNNVTQILVGKPRERALTRFNSRGNTLKSLIRDSGNIDISIVGGEPEKERGDIYDLFFFLPRGSSFARYLWSVGIISILSIFLYSIHLQIGYQTVALIFLFAILLMPLFDFGPGPIIVAACLSAYNWDFFFIPPAFTLRIAKLEDIMMFGMYFIVAAVSGYLTSRIRAQKTLLDRREKRTTALYYLSKDLSSAANMNEVISAGIQHLDGTFNAKTAIVLLKEPGRLKAQPEIASTLLLEDMEWNVARWVLTHSQKAGRFTNTLPFTQATFYPIKTKSGVLGVYGLYLNSLEKPVPEMEILLDTFFTQINAAVEREYLNEIATMKTVHNETDKLYRTLFDSISHELKTPITTIKGAVDSFQILPQTSENKFFPGLVSEIGIAVDRLTHLVENLLDMARLESGNLQLKTDAYPASDIINTINNKICNETGKHKIHYFCEDEERCIMCDLGLIEQALINIIRNSIQYSAAESNIYFNIKNMDEGSLFVISDDGPGLPPESIDKIFEKFYRAPGTKTGGTGLGLSIAKGFIEAHKGTITARNKAQGGAEFLIFIPS